MNIATEIEIFSYLKLPNSAMSDEDEWSGICARAKKLRNEGELEDALELYRKALEITPNHEKLLNLINKIEVVQFVFKSKWNAVITYMLKTIL